MTFKEFYRKENISPGKRTKMLQAKPEGGAGVVATESTNSSQLGRRTGYTVVFATNVMLSVAQMANGCGNFFAVGLPYGNGLQECESWLEHRFGFPYLSQSSPLIIVDLLAVVVVTNWLLFSFLSKGGSIKNGKLGGAATFVVAFVGLLAPGLFSELMFR